MTETFDERTDEQDEADARRRGAGPPGHRRRELGQGHAPVGLGAGLARGGGGPALRRPRPAARRAAPGPLAAARARGVPGRADQGGRGPHGGRPGPGRAPGVADRGGPPGQRRGPAHPRRRQRGGAPDAPRGRGLLRPEAGRHGDRPRPDHADRPGRAREAPGHRPLGHRGHRADAARRAPRPTDRGRLFRPGRPQAGRGAGRRTGGPEAACGRTGPRGSTAGRRQDDGRRTMADDPFVVHVARLRRVPGTRWHEVRRGPADPDGLLAGRYAADTWCPRAPRPSATSPWSPSTAG